MAWLGSVLMVLKYVSLAVTGITGYIGSRFELKEQGVEEGDKKKLNRKGKWNLGLLIGAACIALLSQIGQDINTNLKEAHALYQQGEKQTQMLAEIRRGVYPLGQFRASYTVEVPMPSGVMFMANGRCELDDIVILRKAMSESFRLAQLGIDVQISDGQGTRLLTMTTPDIRTSFEDHSADPTGLGEDYTDDRIRAYETDGGWLSLTLDVPFIKVATGPTLRSLSDLEGLAVRIRANESETCQLRDVTIYELQNKTGFTVYAEEEDGSLRQVVPPLTEWELVDTAINEALKHTFPFGG